MLSGTFGRISQLKCSADHNATTIKSVPEREIIYNIYKYIELRSIWAHWLAQRNEDFLHNKKRYTLQRFIWILKREKNCDFVVCLCMWTEAICSAVTYHEGEICLLKLSLLAFFGLLTWRSPNVNFSLNISVSFAISFAILTVVRDAQKKYSSVLIIFATYFWNIFSRSTFGKCKINRSNQI